MAIPEKSNYVSQKIGNYISKSDLDKIKLTSVPVDEWIAEKTKRCCVTNKVNKQRCKGRAMPGKDVCRMHGGLSTGPKTKEGRRKSLSKLKQYRNNPEKIPD